MLYKTHQALARAAAKTLVRRVSNRATATGEIFANVARGGPPSGLTWNGKTVSRTKSLRHTHHMIRTLSIIMPFYCHYLNYAAHSHRLVWRKTHSMHTPRAGRNFLMVWKWRVYVYVFLSRVDEVVFQDLIHWLDIAAVQFSLFGQTK